MRWGVRRYQNKDGSLTNAGKKRYMSVVEGKLRAEKYANEARRETYKALNNSPKKHSRIQYDIAAERAARAARKKYIVDQKAANRQARADAKMDKDFRSLENVSKKAGTALQRHLDYANNHRVGNIYIYDRNLAKTAVKYSRDVDKAVIKLSKRYDRVSAIPEKDTKTGKMYVDVMINDKTSRIDID